ncbi:MAG TPA: nucleoside-diphosphate kinase [Thermoanaerobaculia bacterium]|jgi:nucleoside-diphosphate kinase|nr:nucleoside-diphosphate kinase [Thermoanaerobaculia bacterium]
MEHTLAIVKPDSFAAGNAGSIIAHLQRAGFQLVGAKVLHLSTAQAQAFYAVHAQRPFYGSLVAFMTSGPCMPLALEREDAVVTLRQVMGATDPAKADEGTIRKLFGGSIERNAIHGSDSPENAEKESAFFFSQAELLAAR